MADQNQETMVNVIGPTGKLGSLPTSQLDEASKYGFKIATPQQSTDYFNKQDYGEGAANTLKSFAEGVGRGASFGTSTHLEKALGEDPEAIKQRQEQNPLASGIGEATGAIGSVFALPEVAPVSLLGKLAGAAAEGVAPAIRGAANILANPETSLVANKILQRAGEGAVSSAIEGSAFGLGQSVHESALGDPDAMGEHLLSNVGYGALFGGALGGALGGLSGTYAGLTEKQFGPKLEEAAASDSLKQQTQDYINANEPKQFQPGSLDELKDKIQNSSYMGITTDLSAKQELIDAMKNVPEMQFPPNLVQIESLDNQYVRDALKAEVEAGTDYGQALNQMQSIIKQESVANTKNLINQLAPNKELTSDVVKGGNNAIDSFTKQYEAEKEALKPVFKTVDNAGITNVANKSTALIDKINEVLPDASKFIKSNESGLELSKYEATMPFSKKTYLALKDLVGAINKPDLTIGDLRNVRESISDRINWLAAPREAYQISKLKKGLMDVIQDEIQTSIPDLQVREAFKNYAINEEKRSTMEKIFGGSVSDKATFAKQIKPEDVLDKMFSNSVSVDAAKSILGKDAFNESLGNYLLSKIEAVTDNSKNGFSSNKFGTFLRSKAPELQTAMSENAQTLEKIKSYNTIMKIIPDSAPLNPLGTAKTLNLLNKIKELGSLMTPEGILHLPGRLAQGIGSKLETIDRRRLLNDTLAGAAKQSAADTVQQSSKMKILSNMERIAQKGSISIESAAKKLFGFGKKAELPAIGVLSTRLLPKEEDKRNKDHAELGKKLNEYVSNPQKMIDDLDKSTNSIYSAAPNVTSSLHVATSRATQFLQSKLPQMGDTKVLSKMPVPSGAELSKFQKYYQTVKNPISVMKSIPNCELSPESIETLNVVYPKIYSQMKTAVIGQLTNFLDKKEITDIPYKTKLSLSMFLGQDLVDSLGQQNIMSNQQTLSQSGQAQANNVVNNRIKSSQEGLSKINIADSFMTSIQKSAARNKEDA